MSKPTIEELSDRTCRLRKLVVEVVEELGEFNIALAESVFGTAEPPKEPKIDWAKAWNSTVSPWGMEVLVKDNGDQPWSSKILRGHAPTSHFKFVAEDGPSGGLAHWKQCRLPEGVEPPPEWLEGGRDE